MSNATFIHTVLACLILFLAQETAAKKKYQALVVEYNAERGTDNNVQRYEHLIRSAGQDFSGDIIVFPESTLTGIFGSLSAVPPASENIVPYKNETYVKYKVITAISRAAAEGRIYVAVNLREIEHCTWKKDEDCPIWGFHVYNTNVVFDRKGAVVARYRKYNLFDEFGTSRPKPEAVTFKTDFGVTFGTFTCFDILFQTPTLDLVQKLNVKDFIFPTNWFSELPFLTAIQAQSGWSYANNVNLLAAGANQPSRGSGGSGIYQGRSGKVSFMGERSGTFIIRNDVVQTKIVNESVSGGGLEFRSDPSITRASYEDLDPNKNSFRGTVCSGSFCCRFDLAYRRSIDPDTRVIYRALAFSGLRSFGLTTHGKVQYCAVVACTDGNCAGKPPGTGKFPLILEEARIEGEFAGGEGTSFQMPTTLVWKKRHEGLTLYDMMDYKDFEYKSQVVGENKKVALRIKTEMNNIITFGIYGRIFD